MSGNEWVDNQALDLVSMNIKTNYVSGEPPSITYAGMLWSNSSTNILYQRDSTNMTWVQVTNSAIYNPVVDTIEVTTLFTLDKLANLKDCGYVIDQVDGAGVPTFANASGWVVGNYGTLFVTTVSPSDHTTLLTDPMLTWTQAFLLEKDFQGHGFLGTSSDPFKGYGGGAILMGVGFTGLYCPSMFSLTGTQLVMGQPIGGYPSGTYATMEALISPSADQWYYTTDTQCLYQYISGSWVLQFTNVTDPNFSTLFLLQSNAAGTNQTANLYLNNLTAMGNVNAVSSLSVSVGTSQVKLYAGYSSPDKYLYTFDSNVGIGTVAYPFLWLDAVTVFTNAINLLSGTTLTIYPEIFSLRTPNNTVTLTMGDNGSGQASYVMPSANFGLGSAAYPFLYLDATTVFTNAINLLSGTTLTIYPEIFSLRTPNNSVTLTMGDNGSGQVSYVMPSANFGLGSSSYPFAWVDATTVFTNAINLLSGTTLTIYPEILVLTTPHNTITLSMGDNGVGLASYIMPSANVGLGSAAYPFLYVDATTVFTNAVNSISGGAITIYPTLIFSGGIQSNFNPVTDNAYGLGSGSYAWEGVVAYTGYFDVIKTREGNTFVWSLANMPQGVTSGQVLTAQGTGNDPIWSTITLPNQILNTTSDAVFDSINVTNTSASIKISPASNLSAPYLVMVGDYGGYNIINTYSYPLEITGTANPVLYVNGNAQITGSLTVGGNTVATESWVNGQGFLTSASLSGYATQTYVNSQGFITSASLNGYAQEMDQDVRSEASPSFVQLTATGEYIQLDTTYATPVINIKNGATDIFAVGYNATNCFVISYQGNLEFTSATGYVKIISAANTPILDFVDTGATVRLWIGWDGSENVINSGSDTLYIESSATPAVVIPSGGIYSYKAGLNEGGIGWDQWGNVCFVGATSSNSWSVFQTPSSGALFTVNYSGGVSVPNTFTAGNCNPYDGNLSGGLGGGGNAWQGIVVGQPYFTNLGSTTGTTLVISGSTVYKTSSSLKYKENIRELGDTSWIYNVHPVLFDFKATDESTGSKLKIKPCPSGKDTIGLIAEEVYKLCPNVVHVEDGEPESILYEGVFTAMLSEMKKLRVELNTVKSELAKLKNEGIS